MATPYPFKRESGETVILDSEHLTAVEVNISQYRINISCFKLISGMALHFKLVEINQMDLLVKYNYRWSLVL